METRKFYEFGPFRLEPAEHLLARDGKPVALTPKTFELLVYLVTNSGRLVSKEQLLQNVWPDSFVEEANLTVAVSSLRKVLGEKKGEAQFIDTIPKRGYRFTAEVTETAMSPEATSPPLLDPPQSQTVSATPEAELAAPPPRKSRSSLPWLFGVVAALLLLSAVALWMLFGRAGRMADPPLARRVAVLPFQNLNHDPGNDFLGFSLADSIINKLGYVSEITIRPSYAVQKYRNQVPELEEAARTLSVDTLLTGSFIREADKLRVSYQLVDAKGDRILRKGTIDIKYQDLMSVQDDVAGQVVSGLALTLSPSEAERLKDQPAVDPLAYEYYLRGVDLYSRDDFPLAIKMLEKSAELYPDYSPTWAHLGRAFTAMASFKFGGTEQYARAESAYHKALALDPVNLQARIYLANFLTDTGKVEQAVPLLREALMTNPNLAEAHWELGYAYRFAGMLRESVEECRKAREQDPGVKLTSSVMNAYLYQGDYDAFEKSLPEQHESALLEFYRGFVAYHRQDREKAKSGFDRAFELDPELLHAQVGKALSYGLQNQHEKGLALLQAAEKKITQRGVGDPEAIYKVAQAYSMLGDEKSALRAFRYSVEKGFFAHPYFVRDPLMERIRPAEEFQSQLAQARERHETFRQKFF